MLALDARRTLLLALQAMARTPGTAGPDRLRRLGVRHADALALAGLAEADGATERSLAGRLRVPRRSVSVSVGRLAGAGRVEREGDEVWLTAAGRTLHARLGRPYGLA